MQHVRIAFYFFLLSVKKLTFVLSKDKPHFSTSRTRKHTPPKFWQNIFRVKSLRHKAQGNLLFFCDP